MNFLMCPLSGDALQCYQCNSTLDHNCQEMFNHDNPYLTIRSTECQMYNAKFCIKVTGLWGGWYISVLCT